MKNVLIVDDEPAIRKMLRLALSSEGLEVFESDCGESAIRETVKRQPDIILLDLGLPDIDGIDVIKNLREWTQIPIIVLTVRDSPEEKIAALDGGAQDFVTKPFHTGELLARLRAVCKRETVESQSTYDANGLHIDFPSRTVRAHSEILALTPIEYSILRVLASNAGKILTKTHLIKSVWGDITSTNDDHLRVHMAAIRKKLKSAGIENAIHTESGVGYRM